MLHGRKRCNTCGKLYNNKKHKELPCVHCGASGSTACCHPDRESPFCAGCNHVLEAREG